MSLLISEPTSTESQNRIDTAWRPACGGSEQPYKTRAGFIVLYMWNWITGVHQYYSVAEDLFIENTESEMYRYGIWF